MEIIDIIKSFESYPQDEIVELIVGTAIEQWGLKRSQVLTFRAWVKGVVMAYFYFKNRNWAYSDSEGF